MSALDRGTHSIAPLSFRGATYSGVFTLLPLLTGSGREHHGEVMREAGALKLLLDPRTSPSPTSPTPMRPSRVAPRRARS